MIWLNYTFGYQDQDYEHIQHFTLLNIFCVGVVGMLKIYSQQLSSTQYCVINY